MTSACISKDTLMNDTLVFPKHKDSFLRFVYISSTRTSLLTSYLHRCSAAAREYQRKSRLMKVRYHYPQYSSLSHFFFLSQLFDKQDYSISFINSTWLQHFNRFGGLRCILRGATLERAKPTAKKLPELFEFDGAIRNLHNRTALSFLDYIPEPQILTLNDDSNGPTMPYGFRRQLPNIAPSLNDLNLPPNPFNILATMAVVNNEHDNNYSPQSREPSEPSPISTPPMNVSTFDSWETSHTTTDDNTFYSDDEPRRIFFLTSTPIPQPPPRKLKKKLELGMSFPKRGGVSQHVCEACGQMIPSTKDIAGPSTKN